ncbi:DnaA ATPase domain-containing protein [Effusibacillus consociatus]|uniref:DnaA ATPase domain-containing protein n=1 Tax=Effusibacillus consociatus TaxID=1117041 RepID=A0ABV9Q1V5_9BACL
MLLHAIGNEIRSNHPEWNILYITADQFRTRFLDAIASNQCREFEQSVESVDVLLFDDLDRLSGQYQTQEGLFTTFNHLYSIGKQLVIASLYPPKELSAFDERLKSRMSWGLHTDIVASSPEQIIEKYCEKEQIGLSSDQIQGILQQDYQSTGELIAAVRQLAAFGRCEDKPLSNTGKEASGTRIPDDLWQKVLSALVTSLSQSSFATWFQGTNAILFGDSLKIIVGNDFQADWLQSRYKRVITDMVRQLTGREINLLFAVDKQTEVKRSVPVSGEVGCNKVELDSVMKTFHELKELKQLIKESLSELKKTNDLLQEIRHSL